MVIQLDGVSEYLLIDVGRTVKCNLCGINFSGHCLKHKAKQFYVCKYCIAGQLRAIGVRELPHISSKITLNRSDDSG